MSETPVVAAEGVATASPAGLVNDGAAPAPAVAQATEPAQQAAPKTLADGAETEAGSRVVSDWPDDWRAKFAGEDAKALKRLERFGSPTDLFKSFRELEGKLSSGQLKAKVEAPGKDATPEEIAAFRKEQGIPESPDKYDTSLGDGFVWADADKPFLEDYTKYAHERNMTPAQVKENLAWYAASQQRALEAQAEADTNFRINAEEELRKEWGPDFRRNMNSVYQLFTDMPSEAKEGLFSARTPDGKLIGDHPAYMQFFANLARELNPAATILPAGGANPMQGIEGRMKELESMMGNRASEYWRGPKSEAMQQEYRDLLTAQEKLRSRAA